MARRKCQHASRSTRPIRIIRQEGRNGTGTEIEPIQSQLPPVSFCYSAFFLHFFRWFFFFSTAPHIRPIQTSHRFLLATSFRWHSKTPLTPFFSFFCFEYCAPFFLPTFQISFFDLLEACVAAPGPSIFDNVPRVRTGSHATLRAFF